MAKKTKPLDELIADAKATIKKWKDYLSQLKLLKNTQSEANGTTPPPPNPKNPPGIP